MKKFLLIIAMAVMAFISGNKVWAIDNDSYVEMPQSDNNPIKILYWQDKNSAKHGIRANWVLQNMDTHGNYNYQCSGTGTACFRWDWATEVMGVVVPAGAINIYELVYDEISERFPELLDPYYGYIKSSEAAAKSGITIPAPPEPPTVELIIRIQSNNGD